MRRRTAVVSISISIILLVFAGIASVIILDISKGILDLIGKNDAVVRFEREYARVAVLSVLKKIELSGSVSSGSFSFISQESLSTGTLKNIEVTVETTVEPTIPIVITIIAKTDNHPDHEAVIFK